MIVPLRVPLAQLRTGKPELVRDNRALVVDLKAGLEHRHGGGGMAGEPQRAAEVVERVGVGQAGLRGGNSTAAQRLPAGGDRRPHGSDSAREVVLAEQLVAGKLYLR